MSRWRARTHAVEPRRRRGHNSIKASGDALNAREAHARGEAAEQRRRPRFVRGARSHAARPRQYAARRGASGGVRRGGGATAQVSGGGVEAVQEGQDFGDVPGLTAVAGGADGELCALDERGEGHVGRQRPARLHGEAAQLKADSTAEAA